MFDLNAKEADGKTTKYLIEGTNAKIKFESGQLAGYEFDLHSYEHGTHKFVINKFQDENGTVFPSETSGAFQISVGDKIQHFRYSVTAGIHNGSRKGFEGSRDKGF